MKQRHDNKCHDRSTWKTTSRSRPLRRISAARTGTRCRAGSKRNVDVHPGLLDETRLQGHLLHPRLDRRTLPAGGAPHRRQRPRTGQPRLRSPARVSDLTPEDFPRRHHPRQAAPRGSRRRRRERLPRAELFHQPRATCGRSRCWRTPVIMYSSSIYPIQHDHYGMPDAPRFPHRPNGEGGCSNCRRPPCRCSAATCRRRAAAGSGCCPMSSRAGCSSR